MTAVKPSNPTHLLVLHELPSLVAISHSKIHEHRTKMCKYAPWDWTVHIVHCTVQIWHRNDILTAFWYLIFFFLILGAFSNCLQFLLMKDRLLSFCVKSSVIHHLSLSQCYIKPLHWMLQRYFRVARVQQKQLPPGWAHLWIVTLYSPLSSAWMFW